MLPPQATANGSLPPSALPPVHAPASHPKIDPLNPTGIIPSSGQSVYEIDLAQFEGSGQPWRQPGSDVSAYFNYGFDETTYPKFLRYRAEMEAGRQALVSLSLSLIRALSDWQAGLNPLQGMPADMAQLLHISMNQLPGGMPAMMGMGMQMPGLNPQQMQMMQQMMAMQQQQGQGMPGMDGMMGMMGMQPNGQQPQLLPQQQQNTSGMGQVPMPNPGMQRQGKSTVLRHTTTHWTGSRPSATPAAQPQLQQGEDAITVKQEDGEVSSLLPHSSVLTRVQMSDAGQTEVPPEPVNRSGQVPVARGAAPLRAARGRGAGDSLLRISTSSWLTGQYPLDLVPDLAQSRPDRKRAGLETKIASSLPHQQTSWITETPILHLLPTLNLVHRHIRQHRPPRDPAARDGNERRTMSHTRTIVGTEVKTSDTISVRGLDLGKRTRTERETESHDGIAKEKSESEMMVQLLADWVRAAGRVDQRRREEVLGTCLASRRSAQSAEPQASQGRVGGRSVSVVAEQKTMM